MLLVALLVAGPPQLVDTEPLSASRQARVKSQRVVYEVAVLASACVISARLIGSFFDYINEL